MATDDFIRVAYPVIVCVAIDYGTALAEVTARRDDARTGIRCSSVVVAGRRVLAANDFIRIAYTVVVRIAIDQRSTGAEITTRRDDAGTGIGCRSIVVAGVRVLTAYNFVRIAHSIVVCVTIGHCSALAEVTARSKYARAVVVRGRCIVVTGRSIRATWNLVRVAYPVVVCVAIGHRTA